MAELILDGISKVYNHNEPVVKDFNLTIEDKEFIVFVGPSGCGKSTILRMIAGLEAISQGDFRMDGKRMNDVSPKDRDIAMVFQNYALYPHMNVYQNMAFGLKARKVQKEEIERRVQDAARMLGLKPFLNRKPKALSGGQRQRVALGRAIVRDAKLFLMDEPLSNLDAKQRMQMRAEITKLHRSLQTTTIYVTHDQTEAMTMATRPVVMENGMIQQVGTPKEVYEKPGNVFVGGFIGSPAMNFFTGTLSAYEMEIGSFSIKIPERKLNALREQDYVNEKLIMGVRPEDFHVVETSTNASIHVEVELTELLGAETIIYARMANQPFVVRTNLRGDVKPGQILPLALDMHKVHLFDYETKDRIRLEEKVDGGELETCERVLHGS